MAHPPAVERDFWNSEALCAAIASRDMAAVLRAYRTDPRHRETYGRPGITQAMVAGWLEMSPDHLRRLEQGRVTVTSPALLGQWARTLNMPPELLWFTGPSQKGARRRRVDGSVKYRAFADRLRAAMEANGVGVVELARRVFVDRGHISRMVNGHKLPSAEVAAAIDGVLGGGGGLSRMVDDLRGTKQGTPPNTAATGLAYLLPLDDAIGALRTLTEADSSHSLDAEVASYSEDAANAAVLDWLVSSAAPASTSIGAPITEADVQEIIITTTTLDRLDRQVGGTFSRDLAVKYLHEHVAPRLERPCAPGLYRELFHAASVLCEVIGYLAFDVERHRLAQRYFVQSLRLAKESDNLAYAAYVMATLSSQALYVDAARNGLRLAQAARSSYQGMAVPAVITEAAILEATAYAELGDRAGCTRALADAERSFSPTPADSPYWISHWDEAVFASFAGRCWLILGDARRARPHLQTAWEAAGSQPRRVVFAAAQLARLSTHERDADQAAYYALMATESAVRAKSRRSTRLVHGLREFLPQWRGSPLAEEFDVRSKTLLQQ